MLARRRGARLRPRASPHSYTIGPVSSPTSATGHAQTFLDALAEAKEALKTEDLDRMKRAQETLSKAAHKLGEVMYREAQTQAGQPSGQGGGSQPGGAGRPSGPKEGEVVDAEFEDLGEKK